MKKLNVFLIVVLVLLFLSIGVISVQNTILPSNLQRREYFPHNDLLSKDNLKGSLKFSDNIDLSKVYLLTFKQRACSTKTKIILNNKKIGELNYGDCEELVVDGVLKYELQELKYRISNLRNNIIINNINTFEFRNEETQGRKFDKQTINKETTETVADEPFGQEIWFKEKAQCTSSSQCIPVTLVKDGKEEEVQPICNLRHRCSILIDDVEVREPREDELRKIVPNFIFIFYGVIIALIIFIIILLILGKGRNNVY